MAFDYFTNTANQNDSGKAQVEARFYLGEMYYFMGDEGAPENYAIAQEHFSAVAKQSESIWAQAGGRSSLVKCIV